VIIENEFTVGADIDTVWRELLDMEGVASCLPGATITATEQDNVYDGSMRLKIGPMRVEYRGRATLSEVDEEHHTAVISLSAREAKGQGSAMATIRNRLETVDAGTRVTAQTDLQITGPQAQFGRGVIEDVGKRVLGEFSQRLEERIASGGGSESGAAAEQGAGTPGSSDAVGGAPGGSTASQAPVELDVGWLVTSSPVVRRAGAGAILAALIAVALILLRRRR
jgi:carbon monoxide dehydrogenase subunit G